MTLNSTIRKAFAIGVMGSTLLFDPFSQEQGAFAQTVTPIIKESEAQRLDKEFLKKITDLYDAYTREYGTEMGSAVFEGTVGAYISAYDAEGIMRMASKNATLRNYPMALTYSLIRNKVESLDAVVESLANLDKSVIKPLLGSGYTKDDATKMLCDIVEINRGSCLNPAQNYSNDDLINAYLEYDFSPIENVDFIKALKLRTAKMDDIFDSGTYLIKDKKYNPEVAGAILLARERSLYPRNFIEEFADSAIKKGYDKTVVRGMVLAFGYVTTITGNLPYEGSNFNKAGDIMYMTSLLTGKYDSKAISTIITACGKKWQFDENRKNK